MDSQFLFLLVPASIIVAASMFAYYRARKPSTLRSDIDSFRNEMNAMSSSRPQPTGQRFDPTQSHSVRIQDPTRDS